MRFSWLIFRGKKPELGKLFYSNFRQAGVRQAPIYSGTFSNLCGKRFFFFQHSDGLELGRLLFGGRSFFKVLQYVVRARQAPLLCKEAFFLIFVIINQS